MMMRGLLIFFLIFAAMVSCRKETSESKNDSGIGFHTLLTRGNAVNNPSDVAASGGFRVWGYRHSGNWPAVDYGAIFDATLVTSNDGGTTWEYSGVYGVWPASDNVSFFAYAPADVAGSVINDVSAVPVIGFTVAADPESQNELLIAHEMLDCIGPNPVQVVFKHALSCISFLASKTPETVGSIEVIKLELRNIQYMGSASMVIPVAWTVDPAFTDYTLAQADGYLADITLDTSWQYISTSVGIMFLMPQTLDLSAELEVTFRHTSLLDNRVLTSVIKLTDHSEVWNPGKSYTYRLLFDGKEVVIIGATLEPAETDGDWGEY